MKKIFKKIHRWLSIPFGIFIFIICFTGASLVFESEITEMCRPELYKVESVGQQALPLPQLMDQVSATLPDSVKAISVTISSNPERTYQVALSNPPKASLFVDQYTGEVKGQSERLPFFDVMFRLHRWLLDTPTGGMSVGKMVVGITTLVMAIILLTGLLIWLTNRKRPLVESLKIKFTKGKPRMWHDLHIGGGIYVAIFLLACALTGLTWSFDWYRTGFYSLFGVEAPAGGHGHGGGKPEGKSEGKPEGKSEGRAEANAESGEGRGGHRGEGHGNWHKGESDGSTGATQGNWHKGESDGNTGATQGNWHKGEADGNTGATASADGNTGATQGNWHHDEEAPAKQVSQFAMWQTAADNVLAMTSDYKQYTVAHSLVSVVPNGRTSLRATDDYLYDNATGEITSVKTYDSKEASAKLRGTIYNVHVGAWGGIVTRIITFIAALFGATLPLTGYYLWIKKRKRKAKK
jgi:uncharacterized iron-regulated membrane protein